MDEPADRRQGRHPPEEDPTHTFDEIGGKIGEEHFDDIDDMLAVWADDELLDVLGGADPGAVLPGSAGSRDSELVELLWRFRHDVDAEPTDANAGDEEQDAAQSPAETLCRRPRHLFIRPLVAAASALLVLLAGVGVAAHGARPDDPLWMVTRVLYRQHAESVQAEQEVKRSLDEAAAAAAAGRRDDARAALKSAGTQITRVLPEDGRQELQTRQQEVRNQLRQAGDPAHPVPPVPGSVQPATDSPVPQDGGARPSEANAPDTGGVQPMKGMPTSQDRPRPSESELRAEPPPASAPTRTDAPSATTRRSRDDHPASGRRDPPGTPPATRAAEEHPPTDARAPQGRTADSPPPKAPEPTTRQDATPGPPPAGARQQEATDPGITKRDSAPHNGYTPPADRGAPPPSAADGPPDAGSTARAPAPNDHGAPAGQRGDQQSDQKSKAGQADAKNGKGNDQPSSGSQGRKGSSTIGGG